MATGPNAVGFEHDSVNNLVTLDGADIQGTRAALRWTESQDDGHLEIRRSTLGGTVAALEIARAGVSVRIEQSVLRAPDWGRAPADEFQINLFEITDSVLDGDANLGNATLHCTKTLGRNYAPVNANCLP